MATVRTTERKDGSTAYRVFFRHDGRQTCYTFNDERLAETFKAAIDNLGSARAITLHRLERTPRAAATVTVTEWVKDHIDGLSGVQADTAAKYRAYLANDIGPALGAISLTELSERDVSAWIQGMTGSAKTIANKQRFLSSALTAAVKAGHMPANVAAGAGLPRSERRQMVCLSPDQFGVLLATITEPWRPLVEFLVVSGCRWSEATALRPADVNRTEHTVRISRAWKYSKETGFILGPTKTNNSVRTVNVPKTVLDKLDYSGRWLFTNPGNGNGGPNPKRRGAGGPVRIHNFGRNVWRPACARAELHPRPRVHDLRHTCASWLIQAGKPLPAIQRHLGHESIQTTVDVYGHLDRRSAQDLADVMGKLLDS